MDETEALREAERVFALSSVVPFTRGGQKVVSRALMGATQVVVKVVMLTGATDPNALERCVREVALLKELDSPNIVKVLSDLVTLGPGPDAAAWIEEQLDGNDFADLVNRAWSWPEVERLLDGIGRGLSMMHGHGYVHRDLSAGNVRLTGADIWKVMDPGFAKHLNRTSITGLFQPGTPGYISPEHATIGGRVTAASDVYCLGILAYQALTGAVPIPVGGDMADYRRRILTGQAPPVRNARPDLTDGQASLVDACLQRQPARRFLDAGELVIALGQTAKGPTR